MVLEPTCVRPALPAREIGKGPASRAFSFRAFCMLAPVLAAMMVLAIPALAQVSREETWPRIKCDNYRKAWAFTLARRDRQGLGAEFIAAHEAFLASDCNGERNVCPRSKEELDLANLMVILAMNAGTASTFLPFACKKSP
jgi:hypothetical protein